MARESRTNDEVAFQAFQVFVTMLLTLPLVAHWVAIWLGWRIFFLADPRIQMVWATLLIAAGLWPFARAAISGRRPFDGLVASVCLVLYAIGGYITFRRPDLVTHPYFQVQGVILTVITTDRLVGAVLKRRRARTH